MSHSQSAIRSPQSVQRILVPEVIQTSAMDCGPAAIKCLLEGFGISASYGRLREACQTDVDGTSIDTLEAVAVQLGLNAEQIMVPVDHLLLTEAEALPALVVVVLPNGLTHFVVVWRCHWRFVQVMDPATGRRFLTQKRFLNEVYRHTMSVSASAWREWAGSDEFCTPLRRRLTDLGLQAPEIDRLVDAASEDPDWHSLAALDAATRIVNEIVRAGDLERGVEAKRLIDHFFHQVPGEARARDSGARSEASSESNAIPDAFWSVSPVPVSEWEDPDEAELLLRGAVLVRVLGRRAAQSPDESQTADHPGESQVSTEASARDSGVERSEDSLTESSAGVEPAAPLPPNLEAVLEEGPNRPEFALFQALRADGSLTPTVLGIALILATAAVTFEAAILRGLMDVGHHLDLVGERVGIIAGVFVFAIVMLILELPIVRVVLHIGRRLETRLRIALLGKIPRLGDRYFSSRLISDMTQRAHNLRQLNRLPALGLGFLRLCFQIVLTAAGIGWLAGGSTPIAILAAAFAIAIALITQPILVEQDMRVRTHLSGLSRFYLDALLGLVAVRAHSAERAFRHEYESLMVEWARASLAFYRTKTYVVAVEVLVGTGFAVWIVINYIGHGGEAAAVLLLLYWTLNLPTLGRSLVQIIQQYPVQRNTILQLLEPLGAPDEEETGDQANEPRDPGANETSRAGESDNLKSEIHTLQSRGVALRMEDVVVRAGGHVILNNVNLDIRAGEHVAIVGSSGAGKSSLVGLLLGWHQPAAGRILVDGVLLTGGHLKALRRVTAWVDPTVQIWNRSLSDNLRYGSASSGTIPIASVLEQANLYGVLSKLQSGLETSLGEGGGLVSGGEGQRVRLGRALLRPDVQLAILDEPFRGLDRTQRSQLLSNARQHWDDTTMICITHDVGETRNFERVLVIEAGRIVEDAAPDVLAGQQNSRYRALLEAEETVRRGLWQGVDWRRLWLAEGRLTESVGTANKRR